MKEFKFKINGNLYEVSVGEIEDSMANVVVNGQSHEVEVLSEIAAPKPKTIIPPVAKKKAEPTPQATQVMEAPKPAANSGKGQPILSPLPGVILDIKVKEGDAVSQGDVILVMEAMKMENNILTEITGTVSSIKVTNGQAVMQNDVLVEIA
ncbi:MAG: biotin/lipoyl-binding protein [Bacteroidales bacterium]|nr:biotin/lipoyl-binding protein [Bacteroidales bacterium]